MSLKDKTNLKYKYNATSKGNDSSIVVAKAIIASKDNKYSLISSKKTFSIKMSCHFLHFFTIDSFESRSKQCTYSYVGIDW